MFRISLILGLLTAGNWAAVGADPKPIDDLAALQGNWKPLQCEFEGMPKMTTDEMKQVTAVYDKAEYFVYFVDRDKTGKPDVTLLAQAVVTLDPNTNPKSITFEFTNGPRKGVKRVGIYELAGNQLKLCYGPDDKPRPPAFKAPPGSGYFLETWGRQVK